MKLDLEVSANTERRALLPCREINGTGEPRPPQRTYVVLGSGRGGTSMLAGAMSLLGVPMEGTPHAYPEGQYNGEDLEILAASLGREVVPPTARDRNPTLTEPLVSEPEARWEMVREVIRRRNAQHQIWGFKDPSSFDYLDAVRPELRHPHLVVIYRDPYAIAEREFVSGGYPLADGLQTALDRFAAIQAIMTSWRAPTLAISFERTIAQPLEFLDTLASFLGVGAERTRSPVLLDYIRPAGGYKDLSRAAREMQNASLTPANADGSRATAARVA